MAGDCRPVGRTLDMPFVGCALLKNLSECSLLFSVTLFSWNYNFIFERKKKHDFIVALILSHLFQIRMLIKIENKKNVQIEIKCCIFLFLLCRMDFGTQREPAERAEPRFSFTGETYIKGWMPPHSRDPYVLSPTDPPHLLVSVLWKIKDRS